VVDEADHDLTSHWERAGFTVRRREWGYVVPTVAGLDAAPPPPDVTIVTFGAARADRLRELDRVIRDEVAAGLGWQAMPAEVLPRPLDPVRYAVAARSDRYVGLVRMGPLTRQPRIGLIAVRTDQQRRGIARALLAHALDSLHRRGTAAAWAEIDESNGPALALFDGFGARRAGGNLELTLR
jgi:ribosomal protein S18 acetylase RimI-like enzyme